MVNMINIIDMVTQIWEGNRSNRYNRVYDVLVCVGIGIVLSLTKLYFFFGTSLLLRLMSFCISD